MDASNVNIDLIRSHVDTIILRSLCDEDKYGYEILNEIKEKSKGLYMLKQPTLYSCLKRLEKLGYVRSYKGDVSNGAQRVYYSLQPEGRAFLENDQQQWEFSRTIINNLLSDKEFDPADLPPFDPSAYRPMTKRQRNPQSYAEYMASVMGVDAESEPESQQEQEPPCPQEEPAAESLMVDEQPAPAPQREPEPAPQPRRQPEPEPEPERAPVQSYYDEPREPAPEDRINYIYSFDSIYGEPQHDIKSYAARSDSDAAAGSADEYGFVSLNELRSRYAAQGYTIRPYVKKDTSEFYINQYYYSNKLLRDCSLITFIVYAVEVLIAYFATFRMTTPSTSIGYLFLFLGIGLLFPIFGAVNYFVDPTKRIKAKFSLRSSLINSLIFILNAFILIICLGFFCFGAQMNDPITSVKPIIIPVLFLLDIPIALFIYYALYKTKHYHVG